MNRFQGKSVVVTGAASGIGEATAGLFADEGASVAILDVDASASSDVARKICDRGGKASFIECDVSDEAQVISAVQDVVQAFQRVDILVNNAAIFELYGIDAEVDVWRRMLDVNIMGYALMAKHTVPFMKKVGGGSIINVASISSFIAQPEFLTYSVTKAAAVEMTRCMALDLADHNIRVNAVAPGTIWTPSTEEWAAEAGLDRAAADAHPEYGGAHMIKRNADPIEVARPILFLASDDASFITAETLMVDGGYIAK